MSAVGGGAGIDRAAGGALRWGGAFVLAAALHAAGVAALLPTGDPAPAPPAPEALVMIDLPPDLALPPMEEVESRASDAAVETAAAEATALPAETVTADKPADAVPTEEGTAPGEVAEVVPLAPSAVETAEPAPVPLAPVETVTADTPPPETRVADVAAVEPPAVGTPAVETLTADAAAEPPIDVAAPVGPADAVAMSAPEVAAMETVSNLMAAVADPVAPITPADVAAALPSPEADAAPPEQAATAIETSVPVPPDVTPRRKPAPPAAAKPRRTVQKAAPAERPAVTRPKRNAAPSAPAAVAGSAASGAGRPSEEALAAYVSTIRARILRARRSVATDGRRNVSVTVAFTVGDGGAVSGLSVSRSSGNADLDRAAVDLVRRAAPLPAIPPDVGRRSLRMALPVRLTP